MKYAVHMHPFIKKKEAPWRAGRPEPLLIRRGRSLDTVKMFHPIVPLQRLSAAVNAAQLGEQSTSLFNGFTFVLPSTRFHLTSHMRHVTHMLSSCLPSPLVSPVPVFSTDYCQPSHAVHLLRLWRRPSESPYTLPLCFSAFPLSS